MVSGGLLLHMKSKFKLFVRNKYKAVAHHFVFIMLQAFY